MLVFNFCNIKCKIDGRCDSKVEKNGGANIICINTVIGNEEAVKDRLQSAANALAEWFAKWRIEVNPSKSAAVLFARRRDAHSSIRPITMSGKEIPWELKTKYLGVTLDHRLQFTEHIKTVRNRAAFALGRLHYLLNARSKLALKSKVRIYTTCIRPIMTYASSVFAHVRPSRFKRMQTLQNRFMLRATGAPWYVRNDQHPHRPEFADHQAIHEKSSQTLL